MSSNDMTSASEVLRITQELLEGLKGKEAQLSAIARGTGQPEEDFKYFTYNMSGHTYRGYLHTSRNFLYGSLFWQWDNDDMKIVRGYPKINYAESGYVRGKEGIAEKKVDGTCMVNFAFPRDKLMGKLRQTPRWDIGGWMDRDWRELMAKTGHVPKIKKLVNDDYFIVSELYGYLNECEFVHYSKDIDIVVTDIMDARTFSFLPYDKKVDICSDVGLPIPELQWRGVLEPKNLKWLEHECSEKYSELDGWEGMMFKHWSPLYQDQFIGKIKADFVRARAIQIAGGAIPKTVIDKAIRKSLDSITTIETVGELHSLVLQELYEDWEPRCVEISLNRIEQRLALKFPLKVFEVWKELDKLKPNHDISLTNKAFVMKELAGFHFGMSAGSLFNAYSLYVHKEGL